MLHNRKYWLPDWKVWKMLVGFLPQAEQTSQSGFIYFIVIDLFFVAYILHIISSHIYIYIIKCVFHFLVYSTNFSTACETVLTWANYKQAKNSCNCKLSVVAGWATMSSRLAGVYIYIYILGCRIYYHWYWTIMNYSIFWNRTVFYTLNHNHLGQLIFIVKFAHIDKWDIIDFGLGWN